MKDKYIKKILDRLERIDHKEYNTAFEFADSASFEEIARCFKERMIMADYINNLIEEITALGNVLDEYARNHKEVE